MPVLKAPAKQPKNATLQVRIDEDLKYKVERYAEFLETTGAYVVSEALKLVFHKDAEFKEWLERQEANTKASGIDQAPEQTDQSAHPAPLVATAPNRNGNRLFR
jgi:predicted transcriptional regulator